jgi:hypothetical protein
MSTVHLRGTGGLVVGGEIAVSMVVVQSPQRNITNTHVTVRIDFMGLAEAKRLGVE